MKQKHANKRALPAEPHKPRREVPRVNADPEQGLSLHQVKERQQHGWANDPVESPTKGVGEIVRENVCTFFNFIFVVLAALLIAVGSFEDMLFLLIAAANTGIGILQQLRSKQTIDKLNLLAAPRANVVREGNLISVPSAQLVRDDVAELSSGDQIPADATVLSGQIQVNEALITGEADAITKAPGDELLSGSFVVSGRCRARLDRVGAESYAARLTLEAKKDVTVGKSEMMSSLDKLIRVIGILLVPIGVALFVKEFVFLERTAQEAVVSMVAALIGMIPEGLYLLTSVALAVSMIRLARGKVLAQDMNCIETLARVDACSAWTRRAPSPSPTWRWGRWSAWTRRNTPRRWSPRPSTPSTRPWRRTTTPPGPWPGGLAAGPCGTPPRPSPSPPPPSGAARCSPATAPSWWGPPSSSWGRGTPT